MTDTFIEKKVEEFEKRCRECEQPKSFTYNHNWLRTALTAAMEEGMTRERESKDAAYHERNMLVAAFTKIYPAYLARHDEKDETWENDWRWIVYIEIPVRVKGVLVGGGNSTDRTEMKQVSWHIHDSERSLFDHLEVKENNWDGHNTERKYQRLAALQALTPPLTSEDK